MLSPASIITSFGGERATLEPTSFEKKSTSLPALTQAEFLKRRCEELRLPVGPRIHEECGVKVSRAELIDSSPEACAVAIASAYQHVYGNGHVMDYERSKSLEAELLDGRISVQDFVRGLAKSSFYRKNFYSNCSPVRTIELDFKHLLGRTPKNQQEVSHYIAIQADQGHDAVVDAIIDSAEYLETFGTHTVPYMRSWKSSAAAPQATFNRTASMVLGFAYSDKAIGAKSKLESSFSSQPDHRIAFPSSSQIQYMAMSSGWAGGQPPKIVRQAGSVFAVAGIIEITRILLTAIYAALTS